MTPKQTLKCDLHMQLILLVSELLRNPLLSQFPITQPVVKIFLRFSSTDIHLPANIRNETRRSLLTKSYTMSMKSAMITVFAWHVLGSSTKLLKSTRKRVIHFLTDLSDTQFCPYTITIQWWIAACLTPSAIRNRITPSCSSIIKFCNMDAILSSHALPHQLECVLYESLSSLLRT